LGLCLKSQGLVQAEQLKLLFNSQVLRPVCALFQIKDGQFRFEPISALPLGEMTGLSMSATEVILIGLRALRDWSALAEKLPDPTSGLSGLSTKQPKLQLNAQEWQVWEFANGEVSLEKIANQLNLTVETVLQIAFRLIVVGLAEEHFMVAAASIPMMEESIPEIPVIAPVPEPAHKPAISQSFLKNLVGFLRSKTG
jgi:hypothetical protein